MHREATEDELRQDIDTKYINGDHTIFKGLYEILRESWITTHGFSALVRAFFHHVLTRLFGAACKIRCVGDRISRPKSVNLK